eukprot:m.421680 g.421680  ORF g.421680 m.421680 type:complete len:91 (-) comp34563_c0_seq1:355-627(-)
MCGGDDDDGRPGPTDVYLAAAECDSSTLAELPMRCLEYSVYLPLDAFSGVQAATAPHCPTVSAGHLVEAEPSGHTAGGVAPYSELYEDGV